MTGSKNTVPTSKKACVDGEDAASSPSTQAFLLVGTVFLLPVILMYSGWSYWVFRGKVRGDLGYH